MKEIKLKYFVFILLALNVYLWFFALKVEGTEFPGFYFLNVGQGDSEMVVLRDGAKIITDAGPNFEVVSEVQKVLGLSSNYIDIGIITHAQMDHFGGFLDLIKKYSFGVVLWNGVEPKESGSWQILKEELRKRDIPLVVTGAGSLIKQGEDGVRILAPDERLLASKDMNDTGIVQKTIVGERTALFTADIAKKTAGYLLSFYGNELKADILKVPHHGSKASVNAAFISAVDPSISVIEVGLKNRYGHPTKEMISALDSVFSKILRTDLDGSVFLEPLSNGFNLSTNF
jgi:beta-lactamase superfamily II metal-dependent hydrolase